MQQRRVRLGDILDDYCPRERRITNHAVVAMIEDEVKQTRCTTCDADHEYKQAKVPAPRKKKPAAAALVAAPVAQAADTASIANASFAPPEPVTLDEVFDAPPAAEPFAAAPDSVPVAAAAADEPPVSETEPAAAEDEWPVHRPLIRATLPRPEGQTPERKEPDFTIRQNGRFDRNGNRHRAKGHGGSGHARFNQHSGSGQSRSGSGHGHGAGQHSGQGSRQGNRPPHSGQRGGRHGGQGRGPNSGQGRGRRGR
jgi:hypothetical protein